MYQRKKMNNGNIYVSHYSLERLQMVKLMIQLMKQTIGWILLKLYNSIKRKKNSRIFVYVKL
jgi:hypothetical protein